MNFKVLFLVFLCLFTASIICNVAMITPNATQESSCKASTSPGHTSYRTINGTDPEQLGDPTDGGWP